MMTVPASIVKLHRTIDAVVDVIQRLDAVATGSNLALNRFRGARESKAKHRIRDTTDTTDELAGIRDSFPFDGGWGFAGDVVDDSGDAFDFVDDSVGDSVEEVVGEVGSAGGHEIDGFYRSQ